MERSLINDLIAWKNSPDRKPLVIMGARQVGKTYLLKKFAAQEYDNVVYLNFEKTPNLSSLFAGDLNPKTIIQTLTIQTEQVILPGKTLIIFDEIQECPNALTSLKYFNEEANEYHICAAGSLLGVKLLNTKGFPVGKVKIIYLHPLDFFEFLAANEGAKLLEFLINVTAKETIPLILHEKLLGLFKIYMITGGMPEAIKTYLANRDQDFTQVRDIQFNILRTYNIDFTKHAPKDQIMKISQVWDSIPSQLAKENKKYIYSVLRKGARAKEFETAIQWLNEAELLCKVYNVSTPKLPLTAYCKPDIFKLYLFDVGLLGALSNLNPKLILQQNDIFQEFKGSYTENYVAQELQKQAWRVASKHNLYYWTSDGSAELDFILEHKNAIYPIEVKSGDSNRKKSLTIYIEKYNPALAIRTSPQNLHVSDKFLNLPLYLLPRLQDFLSLLEQ